MLCEDGNGLIENLEILAANSKYTSYVPGQSILTNVPGETILSNVPGQNILPDVLGGQTNFK